MSLLVRPNTVGRVHGREREMGATEKTSIQDLSIDRDRRVSITDQIVNHIEVGIRSGALPPSARLPSWIDLAAQLGVSRGTVRAAYEKLTDKNLIYSAGSAGTRVEDRPQRDVFSGNPDTELLLPPDAQFRNEFPLLFQLGIPARDAFPGTIWGRLYKQAVQETATRISHVDPRGAIELREAIASHVAIARGIQCSPERVIVVAGFRPALALAVEATGTRGRQAWVENPGYPVTRIALETMGTQTVAVPVDRDGIDVDKGEELAPYAALAVVTPGQQAPTGVSLSPERRSKLIGWAQDANSWIVEDDYLAELQLVGRSAPALAGESHSARVIHIGTFSKTMSPSIGIGFMIAPPSLARRLIDVATWLNAPPTIAAQLSLARFLKEGHYLRHLRKMRDLYIQRRDSLMHALSHAGIRSSVPVGLSVMVQLPPGYDDEYLAQAAREANLSPAPLSPWYSTGSRVRSGLLLNVTNVQENRIAEGCSRLKQCLDLSSAADHSAQRHIDRFPKEGRTS